MKYFHSWPLMSWTLLLRLPLFSTSTSAVGTTAKFAKTMPGIRFINRNPYVSSSVPVSFYIFYFARTMDCLLFVCWPFSSPLARDCDHLSAFVAHACLDLNANPLTPNSELLTPKPCEIPVAPFVFKTQGNIWHFRFFN